MEAVLMNKITLLLLLSISCMSEIQSLIKAGLPPRPKPFTQNVLQLRGLQQPTRLSCGSTCIANAWALETLIAKESSLSSSALEEIIKKNKTIKIIDSPLDALDLQELSYSWGLNSPLFFFNASHRNSVLNLHSFDPLVFGTAEGREEVFYEIEKKLTTLQEKRNGTIHFIILINSKHWVLVSVIKEASSSELTLVYLNPKNDFLIESYPANDFIKSLNQFIKQLDRKEKPKSSLFNTIGSLFRIY